MTHPFLISSVTKNFADAMSAFAGRTYPKATPVVVYGNGTVNPLLGSGSYVQVASLYPLAHQLFTQAGQLLESTETSGLDAAHQNGYTDDNQTHQLVGGNF